MNLNTKTSVKFSEFELYLENHGSVHLSQRSRRDMDNFRYNDQDNSVQSEYIHNYGIKRTKQAQWKRTKNINIVYNILVYVRFCSKYC